MMEEIYLFVIHNSIDNTFTSQKRDRLYPILYGVRSIQTQFPLCCIKERTSQHAGWLGGWKRSFACLLPRTQALGGQIDCILHPVVLTNPTPTLVIHVWKDYPSNACLNKKSM